MSRNSSRHRDSTPTTRSASVCAIAFFDMRADSGRIGFNHFPSLGDTAFGDSPSEMASAYARHAYAVSTFAAHSANFSRTLASLGAHRHASRNASIASPYASNPTHAAPSRYAAFPRHFLTLPPASASASASRLASAASAVAAARLASSRALSHSPIRSAINDRLQSARA